MNNKNISASLMAVFQVLLGFAVLTVWQASSGTVIDAFLISDPKSIFNKIYIWFSSGSIWVHIWATVYSTCVGFLIGASAGIIAGVWLGLSPALSRLLDPYIWALNASPKVALAPLFVLWFGLGIQSKIALAAVLVVFLVFVNTFAGVRQVDSDLVDTIKLMGAKKQKILTTVILPDASSWIFVGIQTAIPYALIGTIIGEMIASNRGLGYLVQRSGSEFDTAGVFAALIIISVIGVLLNQLFVILQAPLQRWKKVSR